MNKKNAFAVEAQFSRKTVSRMEYSSINATCVSGIF
jgi:hypothetical protein